MSGYSAFGQSRVFERVSFETLRGRYGSYFTCIKFLLSASGLFLNGVDSTIGCKIYDSTILYSGEFPLFCLSISHE